LNHLPVKKTVEHEVIDKFTSVIDEVLKMNELAEKVEKDSPSAEEKSLIATKRNELKALKTALRKPFQADSVEAAHLKEAAKYYAEIKKETDPTQPGFMDTKRMHAVMGRALDFNPSVHTAESDYSLIQNEDYVNLFKSLRLMATQVNEKLVKRHIPPRV
jgi:hypothetical protein